MKKRVLFSGGGTAGSVTPLIALADQLRRQDREIELLFIGSANGPEKVLAEAANIPFRSITSGKFRRYWSWDNVTDLGRIWRGYQESRRILQEWRPDVCVSAGSFISVPVVWAARRMKIPTLIHQQDVRPGLANRLMVPAADQITVTFPESAHAFPQHKVLLTGNPVRPEVLTGNPAMAREVFQVPEHSPVLLVIGGGTGSAAINTIIGSAAHRLIEHWTIIHITGPGRDVVELHNPHYLRYTFLTWQMPHALTLADVVVSRVGLGAFTELSALGKAAIFIPMPQSHQEDNARLISAAAAGMVIPQNGQLPGRLLEAIEHLRLHPEERQRFGQNLHQFYRPDALPHLADAVTHLMN